MLAAYAGNHNAEKHIFCNILYLTVAKACMFIAV